MRDEEVYQIRYRLTTPLDLLVASTLELGGGDDTISLSSSQIQGGPALTHQIAILVTSSYLNKFVTVEIRSTRIRNPPATLLRIPSGSRSDRGTFRPEQLGAAASLQRKRPAKPLFHQPRIGLENTPSPAPLEA